MGLWTTSLTRPPVCCVHLRSFPCSSFALSNVALATMAVLEFVMTKESVWPFLGFLCLWVCMFIGEDGLWPGAYSTVCLLD